MEFRRVPQIDEPISILGLGCWGFSGDSYWDGCDDEKSVDIINVALDSGVNLLDVAPVYGKGHAEEVVGRAIKGRRRDGFLIATKCGLLWDDAGREYNCLKKDSVLREIDDSLARLGVDYVDIYQLHWPDPSTPLDETLDAIHAIKKAGKFRYFGVTNFSTADVDRIDPFIPIASQQGLYNMLERNPRAYHAINLVYRTESETLPQCEKLGQAFLPYSPLMQGLLSGRFGAADNFSGNDIRRFNPKLNGDRYATYYNAANRLKKIAEKYGHPLNELAINWLLQRNTVTSVIGSALSPDDVTSNVRALEWKIAPEMQREIDEVVAPFEFL